MQKTCGYIASPPAIKLGNEPQRKKHSGLTEFWVTWCGGGGGGGGWTDKQILANTACGDWLKTTKFCSFYLNSFLFSVPLPICMITVKYISMSCITYSMFMCPAQIQIELRIAWVGGLM